MQTPTNFGAIRFSIQSSKDVGSMPTGSGHRLLAHHAYRPLCPLKANCQALETLYTRRRNLFFSFSAALFSSHRWSRGPASLSTSRVYSSHWSIKATPIFPSLSTIQRSKSYTRATDLQFPKKKVPASSLKDEEILGERAVSAPWRWTRRWTLRR